jgi:uncharacterized protein
MRIAEGTIGRVFVLRLEDGDKIPDCIERVATEKRIEGAFCALLGGIGSGTVVAGPKSADALPVEPILQRLVSVHEVAAVGTIFPGTNGAPTLHMHASLGRDSEARTGCVRTGIHVWKVCEVVIIEILGTGMMRKADAVTGLELLTDE